MSIGWDCYLDEKGRNDALQAELARLREELIGIERDARALAKRALLALGEVEREEESWAAPSFVVTPPKSWLARAIRWAAKDGVEDLRLAARVRAELNREGRE